MTSRGYLPGYTNTIQPEEARKRYRDKLNLISGSDPYEIPRKEWRDDLELWPAVTYIHVGMYLLFKQSPYTQDQLMNYKSLKCYQNFVNGWVREIVVKEFGDKRLMLAKVNHSQRMSEKPLTPWVICESTGKIMAGHCDCMAGLGESCSHVASLLWAIEAGVKKRESLTVTDKKAYWVMPSAVKSVPYARIKDISFFKSTADPQEIRHAPPSASKLATFFTALNSCPSKPAILSLIQPYSDNYRPTSINTDLPQPLSELFDKDISTAAFHDILENVKELSQEFRISEEQKASVQRQTTGQAHSRLWFRMRSGRITASKFKSVCHTDPASPSQSLIMGICYPELSRFSTAATKWGCDHESKAREAYAAQARVKHPNLSISEAGLFISTDFAFLGATPDGLLTCACCGQGVLEVKCPFCHKDNHVEDSVKEKGFCMEKTEDSSYQLKRTHAYYYQVQMQLYCTKMEYCDFVVWSEKSLTVERIFPDHPFMEMMLPKAKEFVFRGILPELVGKFYSRSTSPNVPEITAQDSDEDQYCYCRQGEFGDMIACDYEGCPYQWFHLPCLQLKNLPKAKVWYCPECQKCAKEKRSKRSKVSKEGVNREE